MRIARSSLGTAGILAAMACARDAQPAADTSATSAPAAPAASAPSASAPAAPGPSSTPAGGMAVTERGIGPLRAGMSIAEGTAALGGALGTPADTAGCGYLAWRGGPAGVRVMTEAGRIVRVDVDSASVATAAGARVGDDEARIQALYPGRVAVGPHKYTDGHYLTVTPASPADSAYRIVFETGGGRVTRYHAGQRPQVEYVEGCG